MKKIIYILVVLGVILSYVSLSVAAVGDVNPEDFIGTGLMPLMVDPAFTLDYMQTYIVEDSISQAFMNQDKIVLLTSLSNVPVAAQVIGEYNGTEMILSSTSLTSYGQTINLSRYSDGIFTYRLRDQNDNPQKFLLTIIEGPDDYMSSFADYYESLIQCLLESYESGSIIKKPELDPIECDSVYKLTLNAGDKCVITFNETLDSPRFKIYCDGQFPGGLTNAADLRAGYSYTFVAETAGDHYFEFYDTVTSKQGKFTIYRILADGSPDYMQGFIDGMQQDGSYSEGYDTGKSDGFSEGYDAGKSDGYTEGYEKATEDLSAHGSSKVWFEAGQKKILTEMKFYLKSLGITPVGDSVSELLACYAEALNSNNNGDQGSSGGGELTYEEGYQNGWNVGYEYAGSYYIPELDQKYNEGREYTMGLIDDFMERKEIVIPEGTVRAVGTYLELVYTSNGCYADHDAIYKAGKEDGIVIGRAEGFDSSFITDGTDSIVKGASTTFLEIIDVEVLGYKLSAILVGMVIVMFVVVVGKIVAAIL